MNAVLASFAHVGAHDRVLDAGCGYGGSSFWLAEHIGCEVVGIGIVPFHIERARSEARRRKLEAKTSFLRRDYVHTKFSDASFDVFWALESVVHAADKKAVVKEAHRILRPGGRLVIAEYLLRESPGLSDSERAELNPWLEGWTMPRLETKSEYETLLNEAGFASVEFHDITTHVSPSLRNLKNLLHFGLPVGKALYRLGIFSAIHFGNISGSAAQIQTFEKGYWRYVVVTAEK